MKVFSEDNALQLAERLLQNDKDIKTELESKIPTDYLSSIPEEYVTEEEMTEAIANAQLGGDNVDLSGYATETFVENKIAEIEIPSLDGYAKTEDIPDISNFVEKEDGKGLFTGSYNDLSDKPSIPSISGLVSEDDLSTTLEDYAKSEDIPTTLPASDVYDWAKQEIKPIYTADEVGALPNTTEIPSIDGLASEEFVTIKVNEAHLNTQNTIDETKQLIGEEIAVERARIDSLSYRTNVVFNWFNKRTYIYIADSFSDTEITDNNTRLLNLDAMDNGFNLLKNHTYKISVKEGYSYTYAVYESTPNASGYHASTDYDWDWRSEPLEINVTEDNLKLLIQVKRVDEGNIYISESENVVCVADWTGVKEEIQQFKNDNNPLFGKTIVALGDSFIEPLVQQGEGGDLLSIIASRNNMTAYNYGLSSSSIAYHENQSVLSFMDRYETMINEVPNADYVIVLGGHNDGATDLHGGEAIPIGTDEDNVNTTFKGALDILMQALLDAYPTAKILFLSPFNRRGYEKPYVLAMEEMCEKYSIPFFNNYKSSGMCWTNTAQANLYDGNNLHFNKLGNERMAGKYEYLLKAL